MNFCAKFSKSTAQTLAITIHAAWCSCVTGKNSAKTGYQWGLEATSLTDAIAEVKNSEDADGRGIKVKTAPCAKVAA
jgi:hypothetical protein